jgi:ankyrin repeat protein
MLKIVVSLFILNIRLDASAQSLEEQLIKAVAYNDIVAVQNLVQAGANINADRVPDTDCFGNPSFSPPPLHKATHSDERLPILKYLIEQGANLELKSHWNDCMAGFPREERTAILEAAYWGSAASLELLLEKEANPNAISAKSGETLLSLTLNKVELVSLEEKVWASLSQQSITATFKLVCIHGYAPLPTRIRALPIFLSHNVDINATVQSSVVREGDITLLTKLLANDDHRQPEYMEYVDLVFAHGADPNKRGSFNRSPFQILLKSRMSDESRNEIFDLMTRNGLKLDLFALRDAIVASANGLLVKIAQALPSLNVLTNGRPFLFVPAEDGSNGSDDFLLRKISDAQLVTLANLGLDLNATFEHHVPILFAIANSRCAVVKATIEGGARLNISGTNPEWTAEKNFTPMMGAASVWNQEVALCKLDLLLNAGASATDISSKSHTAIANFLATTALREWSPTQYWKNIFSRLSLASAGALNYNGCCFTDSSAAPLYGAMWKYKFRKFSNEDWYGVIHQLISAGADVNFQASNGQTPLMALSCQIGSEFLKVTQMLLDLGADKGLSDSAGKTAMDYAEDCGNSDFLELVR